VSQCPIAGNARAQLRVCDGVCSFTQRAADAGAVRPHPRSLYSFESVAAAVSPSRRGTSCVGSYSSSSGGIHQRRAALVGGSGKTRTEVDNIWPSISLQHDG